MIIYEKNVYLLLFILNDALKIGLRLVNKCVVFDLILYQTEVCAGIFHEEEVYQKFCNHLTLQADLGIKQLHIATVALTIILF